MGRYAPQNTGRPIVHSRRSAVSRVESDFQEELDRLLIIAPGVLKGEAGF